MKLLEDFLSLLYPTCCPGCGKVMDADIVWCEDCLRPLWDPRLINSSFNDHLEGCYTLCNYEGAMRQCILQLKYGGRIGRKQVFPPLLARFPFWERLAECDMVIPVPLSQKKQKERGYNQVDIIFQKWMTRQGWLYMPDGLIRFRNTHTQSLLLKEERYKNIKGAFHIRPGVDVKGKQVLCVENGTTLLIQFNETITTYITRHFKKPQFLKCSFFMPFFRVRKVK